MVSCWRKKPRETDASGLLPTFLSPKVRHPWEALALSAPPRGSAGALIHWPLAREPRGVAPSRASAFFPVVTVRGWQSNEEAGGLLLAA